MNKKIIALLGVVILIFSFSAAPVWAAEAPELVSVSAKEGEISSNLGSIKLNFSEALDADTLSGITFTNADGTDIKGGAYVTAGSKKSEAVVSFGILADGVYKLSVTEELKGASGTTAIPAVKNYTVTDSEADNEIFRMDLSGVKDGKYVASELVGEVDNTTFKNDKWNNDKSHYDFYTESGMRYVRCYTGVKNCGAGVTVEIDEGHKTGAIQIYVKYRSGDGNVTRNLMYFENGFDAGTKTAHTINIHPEGNIGKQHGNSVVSTPSGSPMVGSDGFISLCFEISRNSVLDPWDLKIYDELSDTRELVTTGVLNAELAEFKRFSIAEVYSTQDEQAGRYIDVADCFVKVIPEQKVIYAPVDVHPAADSFTIGLSKDESVENAVVSLFKVSDGDEVPVDCILEDDRIVNIVPQNYLEYGESYIISFDSGIADDITISAMEREKIVESVEISDNNVVISLDVPTSHAENFKAIIISMDGDTVTGIRDGEPEDVSDTTPSDNSVLKVDISGMEASRYRVMVWETNSNYTRSVYEDYID